MQCPKKEQNFLNNWKAKQGTNPKPLAPSKFQNGKPFDHRSQTKAEDELDPLYQCQLEQIEQNRIELEKTQKTAGKKEKETETELGLLKKQVAEMKSQLNAVERKTEMKV
jgi:hypothetical protein